MPLRGDTLAAAVREFQDRLNRLLNTTITDARLEAFALAGDRATGQMQLAFRQAGSLSRAGLRTRYGPMQLFVGQVCGSLLVEGAHHLLTKRYKYTLTLDEQSQALFRWEYIKEPRGDNEKLCRHHLQGDLELPIRENMNRIHVPTGYTLIEEIIRFCLTDLGVDPLSDDWHDILLESERAFKEELAPADRL